MSLFSIQIKKFIVEITQQLEIDDGSIRVGAAGFGSRGHIYFDFSKYKRKSDVIHELENLRWLVSMLAFLFYQNGN